MRAPHHDIINGLSIKLVNASIKGNDTQALAAYEILATLCIDNEGSKNDHPLQWEALGDFAETHDQAIHAYKKGLVCSKALGLSDYTASLLFAMTESYAEEHELDNAYQLATQAKTEADKTDQVELKSAINQFISNARKAYKSIKK